MAETWKQKQLKKLRNGALTPVPWWHYDWARRGDARYHYPHVSKKDKELLSYTKDEDQGQRGVVNTVKPGRYLKKYFSEILTHNQIADWSNKFKITASSDGLSFAMTREEIRYVYEHGPRSCMSGTRQRVGYNGTHHPVEAYAAGDLAVAYVQQDGRITGRVLCWPEKKLYLTSIYGNHERMARELSKLGFKGTRDFYGARLLKIRKHENSYEFLFPHIDAARKIAEKDENHFVFAQDGSHNAGSGWSYIGPICKLCKQSRAARQHKDKDICNRCYSLSILLCYSCKRTGLECGTTFLTVREKRICGTCIAEQKLKQCGQCGRYKKITYHQLRDSYNSLCLACFKAQKSAGHVSMTKCKKYMRGPQQPCRCRICDPKYHKKKLEIQKKARERKAAALKLQRISANTPIGWEYSDTTSATTSTNTGIGTAAPVDWTKLNKTTKF